MDTKVQGLLSEAMSKIHEMADADTVIGNPIKVDGNTIIPISKVSYGFAGGGTDLPVKTEKECFGGGTGAGMTVQPLGFLVITGDDVRLLQLNLDKSTSSAIVNMVPEVFSKVQPLFKKDKKDKETVDEKIASAEKGITEMIDEEKKAQEIGRSAEDDIPVSDDEINTGESDFAI